MNTNILGKKLLVIVAHPDDESFLAAGTLHANKLAGGTNSIFCASSGERGYSYLDDTSGTPEMKDLRKKEFMEASAYVGGEKVKICDFPDGALGEHAQNLEKEIVDFIGDQSFDFIMSFGEDGYTGHRDHVAISKIAEHISHTQNIPFIRFAKLPQNICADLDKRFIEKRKNGVYENECCTKSVPNIQIQVDSEVKMKALSFHKSQFAGLDPYKIFPKEVAEHFLRNEYFYLSEK